MEKLVQASKEELTMCPGLGPQKVTSSDNPYSIGSLFLITMSNIAPK